MPVPHRFDKRARRKPPHALSAAALLLVAAGVDAGCAKCRRHPGEPSTCVEARAPEPAQPATAARATPEPGKPGAEGISQPRAEAMTREIMEAVARARALAVKGEVAVEVMSRGEIRAFAEHSMYEHHTREEIALFARIEQSLGVLPVGADGETILLDMLEQGVMGIYEPKKKALLIGTHVSESQLDMVVGHEIAHGLQDMHFDLDRLQKPIRGDSDAETARTFLVEGDAQAAYLAWVAGDRGLSAIPAEVLRTTGDQSLDLADVLDHPVLARSLQLPYTDGAATVADVVRARGWAGVDALYADLPTTSEQMLHVDKLLAREPALAVAAKPEALAAALPGHALVWQDTLGEASLLCMLADVEASSLARAAASGWGGDRLLVFDRKPRADPAPLVLGLVAWDSEADAAEFEPLFRAYLQKKQPGRHLLQRRGAQVLFATEVPEDARPALERAAWSAFSAPAPAARGKRGAA